VNLFLSSVGQEEDRTGTLLPEHLEYGRRSEAEEAVWAPSRCDPQLAGTADPRFAVDLDQHLALQDTQDLVGVVVTVEVPDVIGRDWLHSHDQASQPMVAPGDHPWDVAAIREWQSRSLRMSECAMCLQARGDSGAEVGRRAAETDDEVHVP
jgi:hypothetical protein